MNSNKQKDELRLFWWPQLNTLAQLYPGYAGALAYTKEEAIEAILDKFRCIPPWDVFIEEEFHMLRAFDDNLRLELETTEPEICSGTYAFWGWGSE